jgi:hypothetical protein
VKRILQREFGRLLANLRQRRLLRGGHATDRWLEQTAAGHASWRRSAPLLSGVEATIVCVSNRPERLEDVIANYERQNHPLKSLVIVTNSRRFDYRDVCERLRSVERASAIDVDEKESLGACLNIALGRCATRYLAKFDDDDHYGAEYLGDMLRAHLAADAAIVGKQSYFAYVENMDLYVLRFPGRELTYTSLVSGATLVLDLLRVGDMRFAEVNVGEDTGFIQECQRRGLSVFSSDRFNYLQRRGSHNTWEVPVDVFLRRSLRIDPDARAGAIDL